MVKNMKISDWNMKLSAADWKIIQNKSTPAAKAVHDLGYLYNKHQDEMTAALLLQSLEDFYKSQHGELNEKI